MRNGLMVTLFAACFLLGMVPVASAGVVVWHVLDDPAVVMAGPGPDGVIGWPGCPGTADDDDTTTTENNRCNFSNQMNCAAGTAVDPTIGSYSYGSLEFNMAKSCDGGANPGIACTTDTDCAPDGTCTDCVDNPTAPELIYYSGDIGNANGNGTMTLCQESPTFSFTSFKLGTSESVPGMGPSCIVLKTPGGPYTGTPCGMSQTTATVSLTTKIMNCLVPIGDVDDLVSTGHAYDVNDAAPAPECGYSTADILCLLSQAVALKGAKYVMISCTDQTLGASAMTCLSGAGSKSVTVAWTTDAAIDCVTACDGGGSCAGSR